MAKLKEIKSGNPKLKQSEIARELKKSSTIQRYRRDTFHPIDYHHHQTLTQENKGLQNILRKTSKRPQMTLK